MIDISYMTICLKYAKGHQHGLKLLFGTQSFTVVGPTAWNQLPAYVCWALQNCTEGIFIPTHCRL